MIVYVYTLCKKILKFNKNKYYKYNNILYYYDE